MVSRKKRLKKYRLLLVDDEIRILKFLRSNLTAMGYEVVTASNGLEALKQFHASNPDLILLDIIIFRLNRCQDTCVLLTNIELYHIN